MSAANEGFIVFDNLLRPTGVVGELEQVTALEPSQAFVNSNAAGAIRQFENLDELRDCAARSAESLLKLLKS